MSGETAFLGPHGSYSELALKKFDPNAKGIAKHSISEVFQSLVSGESTYGFVPIENKIQGPVTETLDLLLRHREKLHIDASFTFPIRHCLGTRNATTALDQITNIYSHQQALDQCSGFLSDKMPNALRHSVESSSKAAAIVSGSDTDLNGAIAAEETLINAGLTIRNLDIANIANNQTRFVLIQKERYRITPAEPLLAGEQHVTSIIINPGRDRQGLLFELIEIISIHHRANLLSIHSRPDLRGGFVFHIDLEGHLSEPRMKSCLESLQNYCQQHTADVAEVIVTGSYKRANFRPAAFSSVGIIGADGAMGSFFSKFFSDAGFKVYQSDLHSKLTAIELTKLSDVIILSIPMREAKAVIEEIVPLMTTGQLIVENCSIKDAALPRIMELAPKGIEVLGIHTMFGPNVDSIRGENIITTKTPLSGEKSRSFEDLFYKYGAKIKDASISDHDVVTSFVQSLIHFSAISLADVMRESFADPKELEAFSTPNARRTIETIERIVSQSHSLTEDLQLLNPKAVEMRRNFLEKVFKFALDLNNSDTTSFIEAAQKARDYFEKK